MTKPRIAAAAIVTLLFFAVAYVGDTSRQGLCAQRVDLDQRIAVADTYLNPKTAKQRADAKKVFAAIPRREIVAGQERSKETRRNLDVVICSWSEVIP